MSHPYAECSDDYRKQTERALTANSGLENRNRRTLAAPGKRRGRTWPGDASSPDAQHGPAAGGATKPPPGRRSL